LAWLEIKLKEIQHKTNNPSTPSLRLLRRGGGRSTKINKKIALLAGDGIGQVINEAVKVSDAIAKIQP
jgi:hypothetical protein